MTTGSTMVSAIMNGSKEPLWHGPRVDQTRKLFRCERKALWPDSQTDAVDPEHEAGQPDIDEDSGQA
jgi:hypothetical protein